MPTDSARPTRAPEPLPIGVFARTFPGQTADLVFSAIARSGIGDAQFNLSCVGLETVPDRIPPDVIAQLAGKSRHYQISISALSGTCNLVHPDLALRTLYVTRLAQLADVCDSLAIPVLTLATGTRDPDNLWSPHPDNQSATALDDLRHSLHALLDATVGTRVTLAFEPETANVIQTADQAAALLHEFHSDRLGVVLDAANLLGDVPASQQAAVIAHAATVLRGRVALAHAKDCDDTRHVVAPGKGVIDFAGYLTALRNLAGYTGPVIMHGLAPADVPAALTHLTAARASALAPP